MIRVLHFSDPHFGTEQASVVDALAALAAEMQPELVILSGDVTQRARRSQFEAAARFVQRLALPVLCVPGNHDIPLYNVFARLFSPYGNYRRAMGHDLEPVYESEYLLAVGVNSTGPSRHKDGAVDRRQIDRVASRLAGASPSQLRMVVLHHPVRARLETDMENLLAGREHAVPAWVGAGADLLLAGHIHLPYVLPLPPSGGHAAWAVQAGTATSSRVRAAMPNSVNVITWSGTPALPESLIERYDFAAMTGQFVPAERTPLLLTR